MYVTLVFSTLPCFAQVLYLVGPYLALLCLALPYPTLPYITLPDLTIRVTLPYLILHVHCLALLHPTLHYLSWSSCAFTCPALPGLFYPIHCLTWLPYLTVPCSTLLHISCLGLRCICCRSRKYCPTRSCHRLWEWIQQQYLKNRMWAMPNRHQPSTTRPMLRPTPRHFHRCLDPGKWNQWSRAATNGTDGATSATTTTTSRCPFDQPPLLRSDECP